MLNKHSQGLRLHEQSFAVRQEIFGKGHPAVLRTLLSMGVIHYRTRRYQRAKLLLEETMSRLREFSLEGSATYALCLLNQGLISQAQGNATRAEDFFEQSRKLAFELEEAKSVRHHILKTIGELHQQTGQNAKAVEYWEAAEKAAFKNLGITSQEYRNTLKRIIVLHIQFGNKKRVEFFQNKLKAARKAADIEDNRNTIWTLTPDQLPKDFADKLRIETLRQQIQQHKEQSQGYSIRNLHLLEELSTLHNKVYGESQPLSIEYSAQLALIYRTMRPAVGFQLMKKVVSLSEKWNNRSPHHFTRLNNLAMFHADREEFDQAIDLLTKAISLRKAVEGTNNIKYARNLENLGNLYISKKKYQKSLELMEEAGHIHIKVDGKLSGTYAHNRSYISRLFSAKKEYAKAIEAAKLGVELNRKVYGDDHHDVAVALLHLLHVQMIMGDYAGALESSRETLYPVMQNLNRVFASASLSNRLVYLQNESVYLNYYLSFGQETKLDAENLYAPVLVWKGLLGKHRADLWVCRDHPEIGMSVEELQTVRNRLAFLSLQKSPKNKEQWQKDINRLSEEKNRLEKEIADLSTAFLGEVRSVPDSTPKDLTRALPEKTALVDYVRYAHYSAKNGEQEVQVRYVAFVIRKGMPVVCVPLGNAIPIEDSVKEWRQELKAFGKIQKVGSKLRENIWTPIEKHLKSCEQVVIIPDGGLNRIPFAALPSNRKGHSYLLEDYLISYQPSAEFYLRQRTRKTLKGLQGNGLLLIGGVDYGKGDIYSYLPGAEIESRHCKELFESKYKDVPNVFLQGNRATVEALRQQSYKNYKFLHLASHGFYDANRFQSLDKKTPWKRSKTDSKKILARENLDLAMLRSGLALSGANNKATSNQTNGILLSEEIQGMDFRGTDLAVLSACESGLGVEVSGSGVLGLRRAFLMAGTRSVVSSLWSVHDGATAVLMEEFYKNLWHKKMSRLSALRQAQLTVLRNPKLVQERLQQLEMELKKRNIDVALLRRPGKKAVQLPDGGIRENARSPVVWWAAFVLSGDTTPVR